MPTTSTPPGWPPSSSISRTRSDSNASVGSWVWLIASRITRWPTPRRPPPASSSWFGAGANASTGARSATSSRPANRPHSPRRWTRRHRAQRQNALIRVLERAGGVDSTPSAAYHPLEPTTLIPVRIAAIGYSFPVHLEDTAMPSHINRAEAIGAASAVLGALVAFLPWYAYSSSNAHVSVNAFRSSALGDVFFIAVAAVILLLLVGRGHVDDVITPHIPETTAY